MNHVKSDSTIAHFKRILCKHDPEMLRHDATK